MQSCNRKMRKLGSRDENGVSKQSILSAMDRFVNAVDNMNETIMVPSRLMDMSVCDDNGGDASITTTTTPPPSPPSDRRIDLFAFYSMLNAAKNELVWGPGSRADIGNTGSTSGSHRQACSLSSMSSSMSLSSLGSSLNVTQTQTTRSLPPTVNQRSSRRMSIVSSMSLSDSEADTESLSESDSGLEYDERSSSAASNFRHHLNGLYQALQQLTGAADVLTGRYQDEVGGAS